MTNSRKGNMYEFVSHTWNVIKGRCFHNCAYCYMKKWKQNSLHFDNKELTTDLGSNNFIFVGSGTDMFANNINPIWVTRVLDYCNRFNNKYLFQSKDPANILRHIDHPVFQKSVVCTTIESNRFYPSVMGKAPAIEERVSAMVKISDKGITTFVTCEPIMDFDVDDLTSFVLRCHPQQVNIGRNSWPEVSIPEPTNEKVAEFISKLTPSAHVKLKKNIWEYNQESVKEYFVTKPNTLF